LDACGYIYGIHTLEELVNHCRDKKIKFAITGIKGPVRDILYRSHFHKKLGEDKFFIKVQHAVDHFDKDAYNHYKNYALQTNENTEDEN